MAIDNMKHAGWIHPDHIWNVNDSLTVMHGYEGDGDPSGVVAYWSEELMEEEVVGFTLYVDFEGETAVPIHDQFTDVEAGLLEAIHKMTYELWNIPTIAFRYVTLRRGMQLEINTGMQLTNKAPASTAIVKNDYGVKRHLSKAKTAVVFEALIMMATDVVNERKGVN